MLITRCTWRVALRSHWLHTQLKAGLDSKTAALEPAILSPNPAQCLCLICTLLLRRHAEHHVCEFIPVLKQAIDAQADATLSSRSQRICGMNLSCILSVVLNAPISCNLAVG